MKLKEKLELLSKFDKAMIGNFGIGSFVCIGCFEYKSLDELRSHHIIPEFRLKQKFSTEKMKEWEFFLPLCEKCHKGIHLHLTKAHRYGTFEKILERTLEWLNE